MCSLTHMDSYGPLPLTAPWKEFRLRYNNSILMAGPSVDGERFHILGAWITVTKELRLREEF